MIIWLIYYDLFLTEDDSLLKLLSQDYRLEITIAKIRLELYHLLLTIVSGLVHSLWARELRARAWVMRGFVQAGARWTLTI
jgi:hypothetical protein